MAVIKRFGIIMQNLASLPTGDIAQAMDLVGTAYNQQDNAGAISDLELAADACDRILALVQRTQRYIEYARIDLEA